MNMFSHLFESGIRGLKLPRGWDIRLSPRFLFYSPTFDIEIETKTYRLQTAKTMKDLLEVFELRYQIFLEGTEGGEAGGYDLDSFDSICDHIIISELESGKVVGTYRIISSSFSEEFYSQLEFDLDDFLDAPGTKLELGRACIHHAHRNGAVIDLLWRGIAEYIKLSSAKYLFGCSSIKVTDPKTAKGIYHFLSEDEKIGDDFKVRPMGHCSMNLARLEQYSPEENNYKKMIPPLLRSYFSAGSKIYGEPALDLDFECIDFFTILDIEKLSPSYRRRYFRSEK